ncbi:hypothetical protein IWQ49_005327 [Labrenzia sp. EL_126]|nr:hypothetical protein [Labrenzia sp. EL_126]
MQASRHGVNSEQPDDGLSTNVNEQNVRNSLSDKCPIKWLEHRTYGQYR